eukprot:4881405-Alexandrium_andersonii.AAC.1
MSSLAAQCKRVARGSLRYNDCPLYPDGLAGLFRCEIRPLRSGGYRAECNGNDSQAEKPAGDEASRIN